MTTTKTSKTKKTTKKKATKKPTHKPSTKKKPTPTPEAFKTSLYYEEDEEKSAEFETDENGNSINNPSSKSAHKPPINTDNSLTHSELEHLCAHIIQIDEVYEVAFSEFERAAYKKRDEWYYFIQAIDLIGTLPLVMSACMLLKAEGLKPSDPQFAARLSEQANSLVQNDFDFSYHYEDAKDCLDTLQSQQGLDAGHGLKLLQKQLRLQARQVFIERREHQLVDAVPRLQQRFDEIEAITTNQFQLASERFSDVIEKIEQCRGKSLLGLKTGLDNVDERTRGLRDLMVLCAPPGQGKTVLATELSLGVLQHYQENNCAVLFLSLEMNEEAMAARILSRLSGLPESVIYLGNDPHEENCLDLDAEEQLEKAVKEYKKLGKKLMLVDAAQLGSQPPNEQKLRALIDKLKKSANASKVLVVVDYLQLLDTGGQEGLSADRHQFQQLQNVCHDGHTVLAISESRKPASAKDAWTTGLADIKGDGRIGYGASGVFLLRQMSPAEIAQCYGLQISYLKNGKATPKLDQFIEDLEKKGNKPICMYIDKMRAPGQRGALYFEFQFQKNRMKPLVSGHLKTGIPGEGIHQNAGDAQDEDANDDGV